MSRMHWLAYILAGSAGTVLGAGITLKFLDAEYEKNLALESEKARKYYARLHKREEFSDPGELVEEKVEEIVEGIIERSGYDAPPTVVENVNVFLGKEDFDLGEEIKRRTPDRPYIITEKEFFDNQTEYEQINLNYYAKDGALADQGDAYIRESDDVVGDDNLLKFGHLSNDKNIVYIRNDRLEKEYEVVRIKGSYKEVVEGITLEHSHTSRKVPKRYRREE